MKKVMAALLAAGCCLSLCGCGRQAQEEDGRLKVVTTLFPYYDFARAIAGDSIDLTLLLPAGREVHSFEPTPLDAVTLSKADVFLYNGGESELWVEEMLHAAGEHIAVAACMMDHVALHEEEFVEGMQGAHDHSHGEEAHEEAEDCADPTHDHEEAKQEDDAHAEDAADAHAGHDHDDVGYDEHIWTAPENAIVLCRAVCEALCDADEENAALYRENCEAYCAEIAALDADFRALREGARRTTLIFADRFPLLYFCESYDLGYRAAFHGCASDTEPSLATLKYLIDRVESENIPVVYTVDLSSEKIAEVISECTGADIARLWSLQTVSREDFAAGETYITMMRRNLAALEGGLYGP